MHFIFLNGILQSSEEEEEGEGGEKKKKKKKSLKEKICGEEKEEEKKKIAEEDTAVPVVKCDDAPGDATPDEKKGFLEKIKEKLPGGHKKAEEHAPPPAECTTADVPAHEGEAGKEKKGILEKIKEKLPGYHKSEGEEGATH